MSYLTPPKIAKLLHVNHRKVMVWMRDGEIAAVNVASAPNSNRPMYRISQEAVDAFLQRRTVAGGKLPRSKSRGPASPTCDTSDKPTFDSLRAAVRIVEGLILKDSRCDENRKRPHVEERREASRAELPAGRHERTSCSAAEVGCESDGKYGCRSSARTINVFPSSTFEVIQESGKLNEG